MADARKGAPRQRISKDAVYEFLREPDRKREIAGRFRVKPEDLDEDRICRHAVKTGRIKVLKPKGK